MSKKSGGSPPAQVAILAAGLGSRLGGPHPKPLTTLADGRSIMGQQIDNIHLTLGVDARITAVVGFKRDLIMEAFPDVLFAYNERYDTTNTSKSLLKALRLSGPGGVLWFNGDVVFDPTLLTPCRRLMTDGVSFACVQPGTVGDEEVAYSLNSDGSIRELRKALAGGLGEAVGINYVSEADKPNLVEALADCHDQDFFERGIEQVVGRGGHFVAVDIGDADAVEIDFAEDLTRANQMLGTEESRTTTTD